MCETVGEILIRTRKYELEKTVSNKPGKDLRIQKYSSARKVGLNAGAKNVVQFTKKAKCYKLS